MKGEIIKELSDTKVVEVLESMPNDEIADMLDDLNEEEREKLLVNMQNEDAEEVKELLEYEDETVGSIMNTDYISISLDITIKETIELLKDMDPDEEVMNTIYITDDDNKIKGYVGYKNIILHSGAEDNMRKLSEFANTKFKTINYKEDISEAVELLDKYDLLAIPVVDDEKKLVGSVLIHDIVDETLYPIWKKKKKDVSDEDYNNFYMDKFSDYDKPLKVITSSVEGLCTYDALLFKYSNSYRISKN